MVCFLVDNFWKSAFSLVSSDSDGILLSPLACRIKLYKAKTKKETLMTKVSKFEMS